MPLNVWTFHDFGKYYLAVIYLYISRCWDYQTLFWRSGLKLWCYQESWVWLDISSVMRSCKIKPLQLMMNELNSALSNWNNAWVNKIYEFTHWLHEGIFFWSCLFNISEKPTTIWKIYVSDSLRNVAQPCSNCMKQELLLAHIHPLFTYLSWHHLRIKMTQEYF